MAFAELDALIGGLGEDVPSRTWVAAAHGPFSKLRTDDAPVGSLVGAANENCCKKGSSRR